MKEQILEDLKTCRLITLNGISWIMNRNAKTIYVVDDAIVQELKKETKIKLVEHSRTFEAVLNK